MENEISQDVEESQPDSAKIQLRVKSQGGSEVFFQVKKNMPLRKLMDYYSKKEGKELSTIRFMFDGQRIQPENTPNQLEMEDGDAIDAFVEQTGGI